MKLKKTEPASLHTIWEPKYSTNEVLLAKRFVAQHNEIVFTKAKHLKGRKFYVGREVAIKAPLVNNGKIECYAVSMDDLEPLERV